MITRIVSSQSLRMLMSMIMSLCAGAQAQSAQTAPEMLFHYQLADGSEHRARQRMSALTAGQLHRSLANLLRGRAFVQSQSANGWLITSYIEAGQMHITQIRAHGAGSVVIESSVEPAIGATPTTTLPGWWPRLEQLWHRTAIDRGVRTTTILGWLPGSIEAAQQTIGSAAQRGGMKVTSRLPIAPIPSAPFHSGGILLLLSGASGELMLTLTTDARRTGVVAHMQERSQ